MEGLIPASSGPKVLTSELACFSILVAFPRLHKPSQVSDFSIKIAGLYAHLSTLPPQRPTFLPGEGSWPALLSPVGGTRLHGSLGPGHSAVRSTPWLWGPPCGPGSRGHREVEVLEKPLIGTPLFTAGHCRLARRMELKGSSLLTTTQTEPPVSADFCSSQGPPDLQMLVRRGVAL